MSLIDEALKRARMEAAQKAAAGEGLPYPTIPRHLGRRRRRFWLAPLVVALAVIAGVVVGLLLASRGGSAAERTAARGTAIGPPGATSPPATTPAAGTAPLEATEPASTARSTVAPLATAPEPPTPARPTGDSNTARATAADQTGEEPILEPSQPAGGGIASPRGAVAATPPRRHEEHETAAVIPSTMTSPPSPSPLSASPPAADPQPPKAPPVAAPSPQTTVAVTDADSGVLLVLPERTRPDAADPDPDAATESYVQQYPLPHGGAIELGGIAWSETGPFALINGRVVGPGAMIESYAVEQIRPGYVVLTGAGHRIRLSLQ